MEGYQNYQDIINAIKAEYVNARNLKKTATAKKRVATNAKSFKTRKENEKSTLETKLTSVENLLKSNLETSFTNLEQAKFDALKSEVSELKGKLAFIDADIIRLEDQYDQDPENIGTFPKAAPTSIESQSLTVLRNMLSVTISDAESVINNLYSGQDYADIKSAIVPTQLTQNSESVRIHYQSLRNTFDQVFEKTKDELDNFIIGIFTAGNSVNELRNQLIDHSGELVTLKSQLADLLTDNGTDLELTAKEQQIEDLKEIMLTKATDMKQLEVSIGSAMTDDKLVKLKRYATDLNSLTDELRDYRLENHGFLKKLFPNPDLDTAYRSFELYSGFFEFMDNNQFLNTSRGFNNGQWTEFKLLKQKITQAKEYVRNSTQFRDNAYDDTQVLYQPQQLFDCDQRNNGNGPEYYNITGFLPGVHQETKEFYVNYSRQLHNATEGYTSEMTRYKFYRNMIQQLISDFDEIHDEQTINISALRSAKMEHLLKQDLLSKGINGHYEGTNEQDIVLDNTRGAWFEADAEYLSQFYTNRARVKKFELYNSIFPEFYSTLSGLQSNLSQSGTNLTSSDTTLSDLITSKLAAYGYLQTLTETDEEYQAAFTAWNDATSALQSYTDAYNALTPQYNSLVSNLAEVSALYGGGINFGSGFNGTVYSTAIQSDGKIVVGGQFSDYNGTSANKIIRLNTDGSVDTSFVYGTGFNGTLVFSIAIQSNGKIVVGGIFTNYNGTGANGIITLNSDGSIDTSFVYGTGFDNQVRSIDIQSDGKIVVGGWFSSYNGTSANGIIRLNTDGSIDTSFVYGTGFDGLIKSIAIQSDGKIVVGGNFTSYNGTVANRIITLNSDGSIDTSFVYGTGFNSDVNSIAIQSDSKIVVGGEFTGYNGTFVKRIIRLNSNGSIDTSFVYGDGFNGYVDSVAIQSDGKIVVGGQFQIYNGTGANYIIRLNSNGSIDTSFVYGTGFDNYVYSIAIQSNGKILVGGSFTSYQGTGANYIIQLSDSFNAEFEDEFNAATDALNTFETDVRQPAIIAKNAAQIVVNETYGILQPLTEIDEEYVAAFNDWNSKEDAQNLFYNETYMPAQNAYNSAALELNQYLSFNYGSDLNLSYTGSELRGLKDARDSSNTLLEQAIAAKSTTEAAFIEARNSMTFVESTPLEKRQGMGMQNDVQKSNHQVERLESLAVRYSEIFPQMVNQASSFASEVRNRDEAYFAGLLGEVKDFLDGVYSNNFGQNLYVNKFNNYKVAEKDAGKFQSRLYTILGPVLVDWNMGFHNNTGNIAETVNKIQTLTTSDGISSLRQTISIINNELFRNVDGFSFADIIINEVNNGTPLI